MKERLLPMIELEEVPKTGWHHSQDLENKAQVAEVVEDVVETKVVTVKEDLVTILLGLAFMSIAGVIIRVLLTHLEDFQGETTSNVAYPQFIGCLIIGILLEHRMHIESRAHVLYLSLSTGLCGSITTFSGVILVATEQIVNSEHYDRNTFENILAGIGIYINGFGASLIGFVLGRHLALLFDPAKKDSTTDKTVKSINLLVLRYIFGILTVGLLVGAIMFTIFIPKLRKYTFCMFFGPFGTFCRWLLGKLNPKWHCFPIGTFIANVSGSIILTVLYRLSQNVDNSGIVYDILYGLMIGFCGCYTTVSSWIVELSGISKKRAYFYGLSSVIAAQIPSIIILVIWKE